MIESGIWQSLGRLGVVMGPKCHHLLRIGHIYLLDVASTSAPVNGKSRTEIINKLDAL